MQRRFFTHVAAPSLLWLLLQTPVLAAGAGATALKPVAAQALPASADARLTQALALHKGKPVLLNFWATWCEPCREEMPALARLAERWQAKGLTVLTGAVADNAKRVEDFLWETLPEKQTLPVLHDREQTISRAWGTRVLPTTVVFDRRHRIVLRGQGAIDWDAPAIDKQLTTLIN
ncbi:MAG: redoxin family protein [Sulfuritalea sp.]|nr:redoxin family protein [Sulfuritalea sp.]